MSPLSSEWGETSLRKKIETKANEQFNQIEWESKSRQTLAVLKFHNYQILLPV